MDECYLIKLKYVHICRATLQYVGSVFPTCNIIQQWFEFKNQVIDKKRIYAIRTLQSISMIRILDDLVTKEFNKT